MVVIGNGFLGGKWPKMTKQLNIGMCVSSDGNHKQTITTSFWSGNRYAGEDNIESISDICFPILIPISIKNENRPILFYFHSISDDVVVFLLYPIDRVNQSSHHTVKITHWSMCNSRQCVSNSCYEMKQNKEIQFRIRFFKIRITNRLRFWFWKLVINMTRHKVHYLASWNSFIQCRFYDRLTPFPGPRLGTSALFIGPSFYLFLLFFFLSLWRAAWFPAVRPLRDWLPPRLLSTFRHLTFYFLFFHFLFD